MTSSASVIGSSLIESLMGAITDGIVALDCDKVPIFFNSRFELLFNKVHRSREMLDLWRMRKLSIDEVFDHEALLRAFDAAITYGESNSVNSLAFSKASAIQKQGLTKRFYSVSVSPLKERSGRICGALGIFHDVTELKSAEQIRIDFVANVSHELRTPLTAIKGYTDTLIEDSLSKRELNIDFLNTISRNTNRLMNLIDDLLDLSSLESTDVLHKTQVDTLEFTNRIVDQLKGQFEAKKQKIDCQIDARVVLADAKRLEQVLVNLLGNANKYTPSGSRIQLSWEPRKEDTILKVSDNGPGIPLEHQARLFERFYRVDKARSREQGGTGLGLAIVKHIMQRHSGNVWVESICATSDTTLNSGSTFVCRFPNYS
ncbi:MAG: sensor histidine kinase [Bacteriovoracia bacterium]